MRGSGPLFLLFMSVDGVCVKLLQEYYLWVALFLLWVPLSKRLPDLVAAVVPLAAFVRNYHFLVPWWRTPAEEWSLALPLMFSLEVATQAQLMVFDYRVSGELTLSALVFAFRIVLAFATSQCRLTFVFFAALHVQALLWALMGRLPISRQLRQRISRLYAVVVLGGLALRAGASLLTVAILLEIFL